MASQTIPEKAGRLLATGSVHLRYLDAETLVADVHGDTDRHRVRWHLDTGWSCTCPAWQYRARCSHLEAVELVATPRRAREGRVSETAARSDTLAVVPSPISDVRGSS